MVCNENSTNIQAINSKLQTLNQVNKQRALQRQRELDESKARPPAVSNAPRAPAVHAQGSLISEVSYMVPEMSFGPAGGGWGGGDGGGAEVRNLGSEWSFAPVTGGEKLLSTLHLILYILITN